jgi:hypothetical protein
MILEFVIRGMGDCCEDELPLVLRSGREVHHHDRLATLASESLGVPRNSPIQDCANASQSEASNWFHRTSIGIREPHR